MSGIDLDALRGQWAEQDQRLQQSLQLNLALLRERLAGEGATALRPLARLTRTELYANAIVALLFGGFALLHADQLQFLLSGLVPAAVWGALLVDGMRQRRTLAGLDFGGPVADVQQRLHALTAQRLRGAKWMALTWPLLWIPIFIAGMRAAFGVDVTDGMDALFWLVNLAIQAIWTAALLWGARRLQRRLASTPLLQRMMDDIAGGGLRAARACADELAQVDDGDQRTLQRIAQTVDSADQPLRRNVGRTLQRSRRGVLPRLVAKVIVIVASGLFLAAHGGSVDPVTGEAVWRATIMVPAIIAHALVIATLIDDIVLSVLLGGIDPRGPLADVHQRIARLRRMRLRIAHATAVLLPLLALPLTVVALRAATGIDLLATLPRAFWLGYALFAAAWIPLVHLLLERFGPRLAATRAGAWLVRSLTGAALDQAYRLVSGHLHRTG